MTAGLRAPSGCLSGQPLDEESKELAGRDHPNGPELVGKVSGVASDEVGRVRLHRRLEELVILRVAGDSKSLCGRDLPCGRFEVREKTGDEVQR